VATPGLDVTQIFGKVGVWVKIVSFNAHDVPGDNMGLLTAWLSGSPAEIAVLVVGAEAEPFRQPSRW
jgi:hypothetical protein